MYITFKDHQAHLYTNSKSIVRHYRTNSNIVNAQVSGSDNDPNHAIVSLVLENGKSLIYSGSGELLRR